MTQVIRIDTSDIESIKAALAATITTPELLSGWIEDDMELVDGSIVLTPDVWLADSDDGTPVRIKCDSAREAAEKYVADGDWGPYTETQWVDVSVWREAITENGDEIEVDETTVTITIQPDMPPCTGDEHDWQAPSSLLGGCEDSPGVRGNGGGVVYTEVCLHCGCGKHTNTWAQNPENGRQGLCSERYVPGEFSDALAKLADQD